MGIQRRVYGDDHPAIAATLEALAGAEYLSSAYDEAEAHYRQAQAVYEGAYGPEHHKVANVLHNRGLVRLWQGDAPGAVGLQQRAVAMATRTLGAEHPLVTAYLEAQAEALETGGRLAEAKELLGRVLAAQRAGDGERHPRLADTLHALARVDLALGSLESARESAEASREVYAAAFGRGHPDAATARTLGEVYLRMGRYEEAIAALRESVFTETAYADPTEDGGATFLSGTTNMTDPQPTTNGPSSDPSSDPSTTSSETTDPSTSEPPPTTEPDETTTTTDPSGTTEPDETTTGGLPEGFLADDQRYPSDLVLLNGELYWANNTADCVRKVAIAGGPLVDIGCEGPGFFPLQVTPYNGKIAWTFMSDGGGLQTPGFGGVRVSDGPGMARRCSWSPAAGWPCSASSTSWRTTWRSTTRTSTSRSTIASTGCRSRTCRTGRSRTW